MPFSLEAVFGVDASGVRAEMKSLRKDLNDFVSDYAKLGAGVGVGAFVALSKGAIELAGRLSDTAVNVGINVESLQALEAQHKRNGVSSEQLTKGLEKIRLGVEAAREGDEKAVTALAKLHLTWKDLAGLPLEQKYERIAKAQHDAKDKAEAYNAICDLFGEKVGPRLMGSLSELAQEGLPAVTEEARKAGHVMSGEIVAALDSAGDAIDDFKKKITIAVGNIIVNFRSEEGIKLMGMQLLKVLGEFGGGIADAIYEGGELILAVIWGAFKGTLNFFRDGFLDVIGFIAEQINSIMPEWLQKKGFTIDVAAIDALKSAGKSIGDEITEAIARTSPSTFKKDITEFWDKAIADQQKVVDGMNRVDFGKQADALRGAGKDIEKSLKEGAEAVEEVDDDLMDAWHAIFDDMKKAVEEASYIIPNRVGANYADQSTAALQGTLARLKAQYSLEGDLPGAGIVGVGTSGSPRYGYYLTNSILRPEIEAIEAELRQRAAVGGYALAYGEAAARAQFGDTDTDKALRDIQSDSKRTSTAIERIANGLASNNIIPRTL